MTANTTKRRRTWLLTGAALLTAWVLALMVSQAFNADLVPPTVDLATTTPSLTVYGAAGGVALDGFTPQGDAIGRRLATGDFNGDGKDDLLLGAPRADGPSDSRPDAGEVYVVFGRSLTTPATVDINLGEQDVTVFGASTADRLGADVAAGDVNGDGIDDIIIGAPRANNGPLTDAGAVYIIYGSASLSGTKDLAANQFDVVIRGAGALDALGRKIVTGDVNNDGFADIIATAPAADGPGNARADAGEVYGIFGSPTLPTTIDLGALGNAGFTIYGEAAGDTLGSSVAAGDVNNDGKDDILMGADGADRPDPGNPGNIIADVGKAYLVLGAPTPGSAVDLSIGGQTLTIVGADTLDKLGSRSTIGYFNSDTFADLLVTAPDASGPNNSRAEAGEAYLVFGSASLSGTREVALAQWDAIIYAADPLDEISDVITGDLDGDGIDDLVFSSDDGDGPGNTRLDAGEAFARYSSDGVPTVGTVVDVLAAVPGSVSPSITVIAAEAGDDLGAGIEVADVNGDGGDDYVIGAPAADGPGNARANAGEVYVLLGAAGTPPTPTPTPTITPTPTPKDPNGDTDGDTIPNSIDPDDDNDGCTDVQETGTTPELGGLRDPHNFWDFFDTPDPNTTPQRDGSIALDDIFRVIERFGLNGDPTVDPLSTPPKTGYHPAYDRGGQVGPYLWNRAPADGQITLDDIFVAIGQFGHSCA